MKKSTKIIATVIAVTLVITAMLVAIYAATAGNANITANVSWTAQAGVNLEFWAKATGGDENKEIAKTTITPTTTNTDANIIGDLSCNFTDTTDDGVNNPNAIKFTYYVRNKSLTPLNIKVTKTPVEAEESGTGAENHKPKVTLNSDTEGNNTLVAVSSTSGYDLKAGDIFTYSVTLSLAKGGTGTINADFGLAPNFDAGVTFNFNVGGDSNGTIVTSVDGASPTTVSSSTLSGQTLGEYLATQQTAEYSTGWFFDENLTKVVSDDYLEVSLSEASNSSLYCKTASIDRLRFELNSDGSGYLVGCSDYSDAGGEFIIPNTYNGKKVVGTIAGRKDYSDLYGAFGRNASYAVLPSKVVLPNTLQTIGDYAFVNAPITSLIIPDSVTSIGMQAFQGCSLTEITIPKSVLKLGRNAFWMCKNLLSVIIDGVTNIEYRVFSECSNLTSIKILDSVTTIEMCAFESCTSLVNLEIPENIISVDGMAFENCSGLESIIVVSENKKYDSRNNCNAIIETDSNILAVGCKNTIIPDSVTTIGSAAFYGCSELINIEIPNSVTTIRSYAFYSCNKLTNLEIPNSVTTIGSYAFFCCSGLASITIPNNATTIEDSAFNGCSGLTSIEIPDSVISIESNAFRRCTSLTKIFIPQSVTAISASYSFGSPFNSCSSTLKIYCEASSKPSGWEDYWNYYDSSNQLTVTWGVTRAQFDAL